MKYLLKGESDKLCFKVEEMLRILEEKEIPRIKQYLGAVQKVNFCG